MPILAFQLSLPAIIYFAIGLLFGTGKLRNELAHFLPNYLYMAWPHLLAIALATRSRAVQRSLQSALFITNIVLVAFVLWLEFAVPARERGLAWLIYLPIGALALAGAIGVAYKRLNAPNLTDKPNNEA